MATAEKSKGGLEDVVATSSAICYLDGERGVLAYCGYDIHDLARGSTFEEVCYLLWHRRLPTRAELGDLQSQLSASRALPEPIIRLMRSLPPVSTVMPSAVRTGLSWVRSKFRAKMMKPIQSSTTQSNIKSKMNRSPPTKMLKWLTPGSVSSVTAYSDTSDGARQ